MSEVLEDTDKGKRVIGYIKLMTEKIPHTEEYDALQKEFFENFFSWAPKEQWFEEGFKDVDVEGREQFKNLKIVYLKKRWKNVNITTLFKVAVKSLDIELSKAFENKEEVSRKLEDLWTMTEGQILNLQLIYNMKEK